MLAFEKIENILCLGAHCDDIEIGCGGTILELLGRFPGARIWWVVFSSNPTRALEARNGCEAFTRGFKEVDLRIESFRNGFFPYVAQEIKEYFETLKSIPSPDLIFTHYRQDRHQDHRTISELTWNTFRNHLILEYEIPKWEPDLANPNLLTSLTEEIAECKSRLIVQSFPSQSDKQWFSQDTFMSLMRIRGVQASSLTGFAEGFYASKLVIDRKL